MLHRQLIHLIGMIRSRVRHTNHRIHRNQPRAEQTKGLSSASGNSCMCNRGTKTENARQPKIKPTRARIYCFAFCVCVATSPALNISVAYTNYDDLIFIINVWFGLSRNPIICYLADESKTKSRASPRQLQSKPLT